MGRAFIIPSNNHKLWNTTSLKTLKIDCVEPLKLSNVTLIILYISAPTKRKYDLTNKAESIMDLFVDYGLLEDDNCDVVPVVLLVKRPPSEKGYFEAQIFS